MAVPLSPGELENKIQGIYQHQKTATAQRGGFRKVESAAQAGCLRYT